MAAGYYLFDPHIDIDTSTPGLLAYDVALDQQSVTRWIIPQNGGLPQVAFRNESDGAQFEFRLWPLGQEPAPNFQFFGGRLVRQGASSVLHQSEYLLLLVELIAIRMCKAGALSDVGAWE